MNITSGGTTYTPYCVSNCVVTLPWNFCPMCGKKTQVGDNFCSQCGSSVRPPIYYYPQYPYTQPNIWWNTPPSTTTTTTTAGESNG